MSGEKAAGRSVPFKLCILACSIIASALVLCQLHVHCRAQACMQHRAAALLVPSEGSRKHDFPVNVQNNNL